MWKLIFITFILPFICKAQGIEQDLVRLQSKERFVEILDLVAVQVEKGDSLSISQLKIAADAAYQTGSQAEAKRYYHKLEKIDTSLLQPLKRLAAIYDKQMNRAKAIKYYTILNQRLPDNALYFRKNAALYESYQDYKTAFTLYATAHRLNSRDLITLNRLAKLLLRNNQSTEADSLLNLGLQMDSLNVGLIYTMARSKYIQKEYASVVGILERINGYIDLDPYNSKIIGYSYLQIDSIEKAIIHINRALAEDESNEHLHYYLANAFEKQGKYAAALEEYQKAVKFGISPKIDLYHRNAARIAKKENMHKVAIEHYQDAFKYGEDPVLLYYLGTTADTYYKDKSIAIRYYQRYLQTYDNRPTYKEYAQNRVKYLKEIMHLQK